MAICYRCEPPTASERAVRMYALPPDVVTRDTRAHVERAHVLEMGTMGTMAHPHAMAQAGISDVLVTHAHRPLRYMLRTMLAEEGYAASDAPTYTAVLRYLRRATVPAVVVAGNLRADFTAEAELFGHIRADPALARRNRFVLLCTIPERLPADLQATLSSLDVPILHMPSQLPDLVELVGRLAGRTPAEGAGESEARSAG
jgi:hypothetical protein